MMRFASFGFVSVLLLVSACGDDDSTSGDGGTVEDGGGGGADCTGVTNGTSCGDGLICVAGSCETVGCGNLYVDEGEQCDDGNDDPNDGCTTGCSFTCEMDESCSDGDPCNGIESCNATLHRCQENALVPGTECELEGGGMGVCVASGACQPPGCGNGVADAGEDCDDMANGDQTDGCRDDCTYTCAADEDCLDTDACNGAETCDVGTHTCMAATALDCDDADPCSTDDCDTKMGCTHVLTDVDMDGYAPGTCAAGSELSGGDCNDTNSAVYPGAPELCDMVDNNCNDLVDDMTVSVMCYRDADDDGYGDMSMSTTACTCPEGSIPPRADGEFDCKDSGTYASSVRPNQTSYYTRSHCISGRTCPDPFDYNCDGVETRQYTLMAGTCSPITLFGITSCLGSGWTTTTPACGATATYKTCSYSTVLARCVYSNATRTQACR